MPTQKANTPAVLLATILILCASGRAGAADGQTLSRQGVTVWIPPTGFSGSAKIFSETSWETIAAEQLAKTLTRDPLIGTDTTLCALDAGGSRITIYSRRGDRLVKRASLRPSAAGPDSQYRLVRNGDRSGLGVEVVRDGKIQYTLRMIGSGLLEFEPGQADLLAASECRLSYALVPSLVGTDLVYAPLAFPEKRRLYVPSMSFLVGLVEGGDCTMVAAWPPGGQTVELGLSNPAGQRHFDRFALAPAGESVFLQFVEHPGIWHAEPLRPAYLEKDAVIGWKRPFEAKWIGRFYIESEAISYPFYFAGEKRKLWGRYMRSWYEFPVWFDGDKTCLHFEKKFPPQGDLLIYCLEKHRKAAGPASPVEILQEAIGNDAASKLLDFAGIEERPLLAHHEAVCAMTNKMQEIFDAGNEVKQRAFIEQRCGDVARFIGMIRRRVEEYGEFGQRVGNLLRERGQILPDEGREDLQSLAEDIEQVAGEDLPKVSLGEVRGWTDRMKGFAAEVRPTNAKEYEKLARQCRSVAGSQDELAREESIRAIRLMEMAAAIGVDSPQQAGLVAEIVANCRQVLRSPTWWEPRRYCEPKSNPGAP